MYSYHHDISQIEWQGRLEWALLKQEWKWIAVCVSTVLVESAPILPSPLVCRVHFFKQWMVLHKLCPEVDICVALAFLKEMSVQNISALSPIFISLLIRFSPSDRPSAHTSCFPSCRCSLWPNILI